MIPAAKTYSKDTNRYTQKTVRQRIEALLLANVGVVVTRDQLVAAARDPVSRDTQVGPNVNGTSPIPFATRHRSKTPTALQMPAANTNFGSCAGLVRREAL